MNTIQGQVTINDNMALSHLLVHLIHCLAWLLFHKGKEIVVA